MPPPSRVVESALHDLRVAARSLGRARGFTLTAVLTLAVGVAGATVAFALVHGVLLRPMPVEQPDRLIVAWKQFPSGGFDHWPYHQAEVEAIARESRLFARVAAISRHGAWPAVFVEDGAASYITTTDVTGTFFATLGVDPILGRALGPDDDRVGAGKVLVISHGLWHRRYGAAPDVIGRRLTLQDEPFTIVGVMPPGLDYPRGVEGWVPIEAIASLRAIETFRQAARDENDLVARLGPGVTREQARHELQALQAGMEERLKLPRELSPVVRSFDDVVAGDVRPALLLLFGSVGLVLLIAGANVANPMLVRGETRRRELAVRAALGASAARLARQLLAESVLLAAMAAVAALVIGKAALPLVLALVPGGLPRLESIRIDTPVVLFTAGAAFVASSLAGLVPVLHARRSDLIAQLGTGRQQGGRPLGRGRRGLVAAQVALGVAVVAAAGLLAKSLLRLQHVDLGLDGDRLVSVEVSVPYSLVGPERSVRFHEEVAERLQAIPGIESATPVNNPPLAGISGWDSPRSAAEGQTREAAARNPSLNLEAVYPNHFATLRVPLLRGRSFTKADGKGAPDVAIVSADVAERLWPGQDPLGKRLKMGSGDTNEPWQSWRTVVGVVNPVRYRALTILYPTLYLPAPQFIESPQRVLLRTSLTAEALVPLVRDRVAAVDPAARVMAVTPFRQLLAAPLARPRFSALLVGTFAVTSVLLAAVGLYAVLAASVRQRQPEIGVRMAVGATARDVRSLVLGEGLRLAAAGAAIGLGLSLAATRLLSGLLFSVHPLDPVSLGGAAALLVAASAVATVLPVRHATRVDPLVVLRNS